MVKKSRFLPLEIHSPIEETVLKRLIAVSWPETCGSYGNRTDIGYHLNDKCVHPFHQHLLSICWISAIGTWRIASMVFYIPDSPRAFEEHIIIKQWMLVLIKIYTERIDSLGEWLSLGVLGMVIGKTLQGLSKSVK